MFLLTMAGSGEFSDQYTSHSPRTRGIIQHFTREVNRRTEGLEEDVRVTNERLAQLESAQIETNATLAAMEKAQGTTNKSLADIMARLEEIAQASAVVPPAVMVEGQDEFDDVGDSEADGRANHNNDRAHRPLRFNQQGMRREPPRREVRDHDDAFAKVKFTMPSFNGKYDPDGYLDWELAVDQKFACHDFPENRRVRAATSEFTDFASIWWKEHCRQHPNNIPNTWEALKLLMRHRFVPSYYARDLLNKLQRLQQGAKSVEEYYQELQIGMLRCGLVENEEASMARFLGGLNREIQDILDYKDYNSITRLFHLTCKAKHELQGHQTRT